MKRSIALFLAAFLAGAVTSLAVRTASHDPYQDAAVAPAREPVPPMVHNEPVTVAESAHSGHGQPAATSTGVVNTVCAICGMDVDPTIPPATYKGHKIGFGCSRCPPKFAANPDKYGPSALKNEVAK